MSLSATSLARASEHRPPVAWLALALGVGLLVGAPAFMGDYGLEIGFRLLIYVALAEAWNLLAGYAGLVSLGSSAFIGIGGYVLMGAMNKLGLPLVPALCLSGLCAAVGALVVSPAVFRMRGLYFTVGTLALGEALRLLMINLPVFGGASGLFLLTDPAPVRSLYLYACGLVVLALLVTAGAVGTRWSVTLRAIRDDEDAASQLGVRSFRVKTAVFATASFVMGAAGGLQVYKLGAVEPYGMFGLTWSVDILSIVIIGGIGSRVGPTIGAILFVLLAEALADYSELHTAITGLILIVLIRFAPKGVWGLVTQMAASRRRPHALEGGV